MKTIKRKASRQGAKQAQPARAAHDILLEASMRFLEYHPAARVRRNMRKMLFEFLMCDGAIENDYLKDLLYDLDALFELLDVMEQVK